MNFDYSVLNNITNPDFQTCRAQLLRYCKEIERKCNVGELRDCCRIARVANEVLLRHLYKRLLSSGEGPTAGIILQNPEFAQKIGDMEFIVASEKVQKTGNQFSHDKAYDNESQAQYVNRMKLEDAKLPIIVDDLLEALTTVLERAVPIINRIPISRNNVPQPGTTANVQRAASKAVPVKVEGPPRGRLRLEKAKNYNGTGVKLIATLSDADFNLEDSDVSIEWGFIGRSGNYIPITGENSRKATDIKCSIGKGALEKRYHCIVRRQGFSKPLKAILRPFTEDDFAIRGTVEIWFDVEKNALKAIVRNPNFEGQAQYTWYRNGVVQNGQRESFLKVSRKDIGATYTCEITHPALTFSKKADTPYTLTQEDFGGAPTSPEQKPKAQSSSTNRSLKKVLAICAGLFVLICGIMFTNTLLPNGQDNTHPNPGDSDTIPTDSGSLTSSIAELNAGLMDGTYKQVLFGDYAVYCLNNDGTVAVYTEDEDIRQDFADKYSSWSEVTVIYEGYAGGVFGLRDDGAVLTPDDKMKVVNFKSEDRWLEVVPTYDGFCGVVSGGTITLANFADVSVFKIESLQGCTKIESVETKDTDVIGLTPSGTIVTMGVGPLLYDAGQQYKKWDNLSDISVCDRSTDLFGLTNDGTILYAGAFSSGGEDFFDDANVESWTDITDISTGDSHLVALKKDGTVLAAGDNQYGQCNVGEWKDIVRVEANSDSTVGYSSTGEIYVAGYNYLADKLANSVD